MQESNGEIGKMQFAMLATTFMATSSSAFHVFLLTTMVNLITKRELHIILKDTIHTESKRDIKWPTELPRGHIDLGLGKLLNKPTHVLLVFHSSDW